MNEKDVITQIINMDKAEIDSWIADRVELLERTAIEDRDEISSASYTLRRARGEKENTEVQGFIPSKTRLRKMQFDLASFRMDDTSFYKSVIDYIKKAKTDRIMRDGKINNNYIMNIVQYSIINYLGLHSSESRRNALYNSRENIDDEPLSICNFKQNGTAMCVEKSAMAQNILAFLGYNPMMIFGYLSKENGIINEGHAYNCIIRNGKAILIDFTNPIMKDSKYHKPAMFSIDSDKLEDFKKGKGQIEVTHKDLHTKGDQIEEEHIQLVYSSEDIDEKYFDKKKSPLEKAQEQTQIVHEQNRLTLDDVTYKILPEKVLNSEAQNQTKDADEALKIKRLMFKQKTGKALTVEEQALIDQYVRQTNEEQVRYRNQQAQKRSKGLSL